MAHLSLHWPSPGPGGVAYPPVLVRQLKTELADKGPHYHARTRHLSPCGQPMFINRLIHETSPYLQQHAHNPVDWHPWGQAAFALARSLNRPVFLSIGYSTCHWCHVMEEESFEDLEIAAYLNSHYIAVKVDREERPDVDALYLACVQAWTGRGGWPMTLWLTGEQKPFFGGTYFPPCDGARGVRTGLQSLLVDMYKAYTESSESIDQAATQVLNMISVSQLTPPKATSIAAPALAHGPTVLANALEVYERLYDTEFGGRCGAPKFPCQFPVRLLMRLSGATSMVEHTLTQMAAGGIHDHIGGGFHRYSVDVRWRVPHFEKMLYDNAQLALAYTEAAQLTGKQEYADVARSTLDYIRFEMTSPQGGFYAATDADSPNPASHGAYPAADEGRYFTWTPAELEAVLGPDLAPIAASLFGVTAAGPVAGRCVAFAAHTPAQTAASFRLSTGAVTALLQQLRPLLANARRKRPPPGRDDKIIAAWNGLMISAFAKAAQVLHAPEYLEAARQAAVFVRDHLMEKGQLRRSYRDRVSATCGFLEDYAFMVQACLDLFEAGYDPEWFDLALHLTGDIEDHFAAPDGAYYASAHTAEPLLMRSPPAADGALPAASSVHALNLARLAAFTDDPRYRKRAEAVVAAALPELTASPAALPHLLLALHFLQMPLRQIVVILALGADPEAPALLRLLASRFHPAQVMIVASAATLPALATKIPALGAKTAESDRTSVYICDGATCLPPVHDCAGLLKLQLS